MSTSMGDLVTHLIANTVGFQQGFAKAQSIATSGAAGIRSAIAPLTGALAAAFGAGSALSAARDDLQAMRRLEAVIKATGGAAGFTAEEIGNYATELQRATNFGDEVTVGAAAILATFKNIRGDNFKTALGLAQDMATVLGIDINKAAKTLGKSLKEVAPEDVAAKLEELTRRFGGAAASVADPWTQLKNAIGDIGEQVGYLLLPAVDAISAGLMDVAIQGKDTFASLQQTVQDWVDGGVVAYQTLGDSAYLFYLQAELAAVQTAAAFGHFFKDELPAFFTWFQDNWQDIMFTAADYAFTVFANVGHNIREAWQAVVDFVAGNPIQPDFKRLTEGAVNAIKEMPNIPERIKSDFEKSLEDDIKTQQEFIQRRQDEIARDILQRRDEKERNRKGFLPGEGETGGLGTKQEKDLRIGAFQKGSSDAVSAIQSAMREVAGGNIAKKQIEELEQVNENLEELVSIERDRSRAGVELIAGSLA